MKILYRYVNLAVLRVIFCPYTRETILEGKNRAGERSTQRLPESSSQFHSIVELKVRCASLAFYSKSQKRNVVKILHRRRILLTTRFLSGRKFLAATGFVFPPACRLSATRQRSFHASFRENYHSTIT